MQVTLEVPDPLYRALEQQARLDGKSVEEVLLEGASGHHANQQLSTPVRRRRVQLPLVAAGEPGTIDLTQNLNDAFFNDDDFQPA